MKLISCVHFCNTIQILRLSFSTPASITSILTSLRGFYLLAKKIKVGVFGYNDNNLVLQNTFLEPSLVVFFDFISLKCYNLWHLIAMVAAQKPPHLFIQPFACFDTHCDFRFSTNPTLPMIVAFDFVRLHTSGKVSFAKLFGKLARFFFARCGGVNNKRHITPFAYIFLYRYF